MCTWECGPVWEHARRWRVGHGSAGGRLGVWHWPFLYPAGLCARPDFAFCEFSFGPDTQSFRVAGVWVLSTRTFRVAGGDVEEENYPFPKRDKISKEG